ncbi:hypothetical protein ACVIIV_005072 [Bradyrhizobium sp. USDA 4354]
MGQEQRIFDGLRAFERLCQDLAADAASSEGRAGLLEIAANYRAEAARMCDQHISSRAAQRHNQFANTVPTQSFFGRFVFSAKS